MTTRDHRSSSIILVVAWLIVALPGAWGVEQTIDKSLDLFRHSAPAAMPAPPITPPAH